MTIWYVSPGRGNLCARGEIGRLVRAQRVGVEPVLRPTRPVTAAAVAERDAYRAVRVAGRDEHRPLDLAAAGNLDLHHVHWA